MVGRLRSGTVIIGFQHVLTTSLLVSCSCMAAGRPQQPMCLKEPDENTPLPCDDMSWEHRVKFPRPACLFESTDVLSNDRHNQA